ncbi:MAG: glycosyltransferase [Candidatus Electrothrix sp. EH2]|nr:glycosyltransferase [Candidatus Electrothrix sp. EH2]
MLQRYDHLHIICESDNGQSQALNKGISCADPSSIISWLNSDDMLTDGVFEKLNDIFSDKSIDIIYGDSLVVNEVTGKQYVNKAVVGNVDDFRYWWRGKVKIHQPSVFFRKSVYDEVGPFREDLHYIMDYEYWERSRQTFDFKKIDGIFSVQRFHKNAKTYEWHKFFQEKEVVFSKHYRNDNVLMQEKKRIMADKYYRLAQSSLEWRGYRYSIYMLLKAAEYNYLYLFKPQFFKLFITSLLRKTH